MEVTISDWQDLVDRKRKLKKTWADEPALAFSLTGHPSPLRVVEEWRAHGHTTLIRAHGDYFEGMPKAIFTTNWDAAIERTLGNLVFFAQDESMAFPELTHVHQQWFYDEPELRQIFRECVDEWVTATELTSSLTDMVLHPAYQRIIGLGKQVLPLLLRELRDRPDYWFWALRSVAGQDPNPPNPTFDEAMEGWLEWGRQHGYVV